MRLCDAAMAAGCAPLASRVILGGQTELKVGEIGVNLRPHLARTAGSGDPEKSMGACKFPEQADSSDHRDIVRRRPPYAATIDGAGRQVVFCACRTCS
jgi:hypothetical protein